jgi:hypothetical protein
MSALTYDQYVSLGHNCEVSFQHRRVLGRGDSGFFSWNITTLPALESLISNDFVGILQEEQLEDSGDGFLLRDRSHNFLFHSPFLKNDFRADPDYAEKLKKLRSKFAHFYEKFHANARSGERVAYFYKAQVNTPSEEVRVGAHRVHQLLMGLHDTRPFSLIVLQQEEQREAPWPEKGIFNRYLKRLAPWHDATDGHVSSWDRIFQEFPHTDGLRLAGY